MHPVFHCFAILLVAQVTCHAETRNWTDVKGRRIEAELVSYDTENEMIRIRKSDGKTHSIPVEKLSEADREWLKEQDAEGGDEGTADGSANRSAKAGSTVEMLSDGSPQMTYHVYYPSSYKDGGQPPLLILFNSGGDSKPLLNHVRKGCDSLGWIAIGCDWKKGQGMHDETFPSTLKHIEKNISYDQNAMYLGGMSAGTLTAYGLTAKIRRKWRGVIAFGGWLGPGGLETARKLRVAMVNGDKDDGANKYVERDTKYLKRRSCKVKLVSFPGGHVVAPPNVTEEAMKWLDGEGD